MLKDKVLQGLDILVIDDDIELADTLCEVLEDLGAVVQLPIHSFVLALAAVAMLDPKTLVVLDVDLGGTLSFPVARILAARGIPFVLISGRVRYDDVDINPAWLFVDKPFRVAQLCAALKRVSNHA